MNKKDKEEKEKEAQREFLTTPSSWFCQRGFHNWSRWVYCSIKIFDEKKFLYVRPQQRRLCVRCGLDVRRYVT